MKVYIAGPMTGLPEFNFPAFHAAAKQLRERGYEVINPAEVNPDVTLSWAECMRRDIPELISCQAVAVLPDWQKSRGAILEVHIAQNLLMAVAPVEFFLNDAASLLAA